VISELLNIPKLTLFVIYNNLIRTGILQSKVGINGGVRFAKNAEQNILLHILMAIVNQKALFQTTFELNVSSRRPDSLKKAIAETLNNVKEVL
jgi:DNA-binding IscR family transcriptional regulator